MALVPVTRERLTRFTRLNGLSVTPENARSVIGHVTSLRRWRLASLIIAIPIAGFINDPIYIVLAWFAAYVAHWARPPAQEPQAPGNMKTYWGIWSLRLACVAVAVYSLLEVHERPNPIPAVYWAHVVVVIILGVALPPPRRPRVESTPIAPGGMAQAEPKPVRWPTRTLHIAGTIIIVSGALTIPGRPPERGMLEYSVPMTYPEETAQFRSVERVDEPTCAWFGQADDPCMYWRVDYNRFPQAAPYIIEKGGVPRLAPFTYSS